MFFFLCPLKTILVIFLKSLIFCSHLGQNLLKILAKFRTPKNIINNKARRAFVVFNINILKGQKQKIYRANDFSLQYSFRYRITRDFV